MCYTAPVLGAIVASAAWQKTKSPKAWWLTLLFWGGALFGVVDHWWNGELFLISPDIGRDLLLGVTISAVILAVWGVAVAWGRKNPVLQRYLCAPPA